ncbi:MAG: DNA polymerase III subunit gamma/tau [Dehalococcoidales bacterium]|nr:DNA polymerase III subunit gamma/tau [Dehalococcoidales bacterium]
MTSQVFYRKWRPQTLAEVVGQEAVTQTLRNALATGRISHAYLFCGPRGTGKTSTGRILAKAVNCLTSGNGEPCNTCSMCQAITEARALDVIEIDAASNTGVEDIRSLREKVNYVPNQARYKVYIIDEVHMLSNSAANALLKTLEEPPPHVIFILATTEVHKILPTILSRCQRFDFRRLSQADVISKLADICQKEGIHIEPEALRLIARNATGSLRDAENLLEQLATYYGSEVSLQQVQSVLGITGDWRARELVKYIISSDIAAGLTLINSVNSDGLDLKQFNREVVSYLRGLLLIKTGSDESVDLSQEDRAELKELATGVSLEQILRAVKLFGQLAFSLDNYSTLPLELALVDSALTAEKEKESPARPKSEAGFSQLSRPAAPPSVVSSPRRSTAEPAPVLTPEPEKNIPAPEPAMTAAAPPLVDGSEVEQLKQNWKQVIEQAPQDTKKSPAIAILRSAGVRPVSLESDTLVLAFRHAFHKEQMEKLENQRVAERIISCFLGRTCQINCVLEDNNHLLKAALKMGAQILDPEGE